MEGRHMEKDLAHRPWVDGAAGELMQAAGQAAEQVGAAVTAPCAMSRGCRGAASQRSVGRHLGEKGGAHRPGADGAAGALKQAAGQTVVQAGAAGTAPYARRPA